MIISDSTALTLLYFLSIIAILDGFLVIWVDENKIHKIITVFIMTLLVYLMSIGFRFGGTP